MNQPSDAHRRTWQLLPWIANGRATPSEQRSAGAHLALCASCRHELAKQRELLEAVSATTAPDGDVETGLQRLLSRIDEATTDSMSATRRAGARPALARCLAAAVVVESLALGVVGVVLAARFQAPEYRTLVDAAPVRGATIRIVPTPGLRLDQLERLLGPLDLQVVGGPNGAGAYDLAPRSAGPDRQRQLALLRADPGLRLVEPIDTPGAPR